MTFSPTSMNGFNNAEYFDLESTYVEDKFRIFVSRPAMTEPGEVYPALLVLDANMMFGTARETVGALSMTGDVPAQFVIGIGYE